ncbi:hypothetical protein XELAEV_18030992mg [Xenopus laevis]|uniref:Uncharacterized protein n=1 Tax=Xenopus laevis TaxID=8355 RepID=A0A974CLX9_XENLA|nr:hypothetical protein XELAEV_18030992mg [Xenopus laevis]
MTRFKQDNCKFFLAPSESEVLLEQRFHFEPSNRKQPREFIFRNTLLQLGKAMRSLIPFAYFLLTLFSTDLTLKVRGIALIQLVFTWAEFPNRVDNYHPSIADYCY